MNRPSFAGSALLAIAFLTAACSTSSEPTASAPDTPPPDRVAVYAALGTELIRYEVSIERGELARKESVRCPASIQYVWPHPSKEYLYVAWSDGGPSGAAGAPTGGALHGVTAFRVGAAGELTPHGNPLTLVSRPVHLSTDLSGENLLVAHTVPSAITVYRIGPGGILGLEVKQDPSIDAGIYAHQVRVDPGNREAILVTRGNGPAGGKREDPGALKVFGFDPSTGLLANRQSVAPGRGFGFQPRHLDFHPSGAWVFVSVERQNQLHVYGRTKDGKLTPSPLFNKTSLAPGTEAKGGQAAGTVHVHPNGKFFYQANRAGGTMDFEGTKVFAGGENSIAVYAIDAATGEPALIQSADTHGFSPRTFALDPDGRMLVAANQVPMRARTASGVETIPASLAVFRVGEDGKLTFVRKYDVEATNASSLFWMGLAPLP